jgi:hypothetical protein
VLACGTPPPPRVKPAPPPPVVSVALPPRDPCEPLEGKPAAPLGATYDGVLAKARCQPEVVVVMQGVARALGVDCPYCHEPGNFAAPTHQKQVANWMAKELVPQLTKRAGGPVACADCHAGRAKLLGSPRSRQRAVEWMTTRLVERFDTAAGKPLYCKTCHRENLGKPGFRRQIILGDLFGEVPPPAAEVP